MDENMYSPVSSEANGCFKEAVCIDAMRVYDSCSDKDCLEDLRVYFSPEQQELVENASNVRLRGADVITVYLDLEPVPFNKGFYSVDMTFFFDVCLDVFCAPNSGSAIVNGVSVFNKKVILYGSEGNVKMFNSDNSPSEPEIGCGKILPKANVQVAQPIGLSARLCDTPATYECACHIPDCISKRYGGFVDTSRRRSAYVTIGLFTIVQIVRNVQMLIPAYDFCIPEKECVTSSDNPCEMFNRIDFPMEEFFPPKVGDLSCGCEKSKRY